MGWTLIIFSPLFYSFTLNITNVLLIILISVIDTLGNYFYFKTFEKTDASIATPLLSLAPVFTFLFGWLILNDTVSLHTYILAFIIILSIIVLSTDFRRFGQFKLYTLFPAISASLLFGISAIPIKILLNTNAINAPTLYMLRAVIVAFLVLTFFRKSVIRLSIRDYGFIFFRGLFVIAQCVLLYTAIGMGNAGVSMTLGNITPLFVFILSFFFLQEKPTMKKAITCILILAISAIL
jgi:drug/metabolite transporter (DMT)-like permease